MQNLLLTALLGLPTFQDTPIPAPNTIAAPQDGNAPDRAWFGSSLPFKKSRGFDLIYSKPGLNLKGTHIWVQEWPTPVLPLNRKKADYSRAQELSKEFPDLLERHLEFQLTKMASVSRKEGNVVLSGRIVDCSAGNLAAELITGTIVPFSGAFVNGSITWELKLEDSRTHEILIAIHHHVIVDDKSRINDWTQWFGKMLTKHVGN